MREIHLTRGQSTIVDDEDYDSLIQWKWFAHLNPSNSFYATRSSPRNPGPRGLIWMHRVIMKCPDGMYIDHINKNTLDNRKANLRICTKSQNAANSKLRIDNKYGYKGVRYHKKNKNYNAYIRHNGKDIHIGCYNSIIEAALAYDNKAIELFGEFARINYPIYT